MKTSNPFMLKEAARAVTNLTHTITNLMWYEYSNGVPISYILDNYDMVILLDIRSGVKLRIGDILYPVNNKSYNSIVSELSTHIVNHIANKFDEQGLYVNCNTRNIKNIEKFVKDNTELIREWYVKSVNA